VSKVRETAAERSIEFSIEIVETGLPLFVAEEELHETLVGVLSFLTQDAVEGSRIRIRSSGHNQSLELEFANTGFGIPDQRFQNCLSGTDLLNGAEFRSLRRAARVVRHWGGVIEGHSAVGEGTRMVLRLQGFI
jgi:signal transduction histidine kinase